MCPRHRRLYVLDVTGPPPPAGTDTTDLGPTSPTEGDAGRSAPADGAPGGAAGPANALAAADQPAGRRASWSLGRSSAEFHAHPEATAALQVSRQARPLLPGRARGARSSEDLDLGQWDVRGRCAGGGWQLRAGCAPVRGCAWALDVECDVLQPERAWRTRGGLTQDDARTMNRRLRGTRRAPGQPPTPPWEPVTLLQRQGGLPGTVIPPLPCSARPGLPPIRRPLCSTGPGHLVTHRPGSSARRAGERHGSLDAALGDLADRFEPVPGPHGSARLGVGAEAEVWLVRDREHGRLAALKLYRPDPLLDPRETFDASLRERLADPALRAYVPELFGWGWARTDEGRDVAWEAMEYFELGSLADLIRREAGCGPLHPERAKEIGPGYRERPGVLGNGHPAAPDRPVTGQHPDPAGRSAQPRAV